MLILALQICGQSYIATLIITGEVLDEPQRFFKELEYYAYNASADT